MDGLSGSLRLAMRTKRLVPYLRGYLQRNNAIRFSGLISVLLFLMANSL
jgi:hypothetical protein